MDFGYRILEKKALALGKADSELQSADEEYRRILRGQDSKTANCPVFQQIAALSAAETHLMAGCAVI
jgi:hypothetical protein